MQPTNLSLDFHTILKNLIQLTQKDAERLKNQVHFLINLHLKKLDHQQMHRRFLNKNSQLKRSFGNYVPYKLKSQQKIKYKFF